MSCMLGNVKKERERERAMKAHIDQIITEEVRKAIIASEAQCQQQHDVYMKAAMEAARAENDRLATDIDVITTKHHAAE